jgi:hypothetical protein
MKLTDALMNARIEKGIELALRKGRPGWLEDADLNRLDMGKADQCLIALATGMSYVDGLAMLGLSPAEAPEYGLIPVDAGPLIPQFERLTMQVKHYLLAERIKRQHNERAGGSD